jgi:hypothetical protein
MLKVQPEAHSSDQSATNLSGGKIKRNKDLDDLARRIKELPQRPASSGIPREIYCCSSHPFLPLAY